jgi:TIR domain-containing protein
MNGAVINKRPYRAFISYAHANKVFCDSLYRWLKSFADMSVWYDSVEFPSGLVGSELGRAIEACQSAIIILTNEALASGWVEQEWNICIEQKNAFPDFQIAMLNLDGCTPPAALRVRKWIDVADLQLGSGSACQLLEALHWHTTRPSELSRTTFYLSRGSRPAEVEKSEGLLSRIRALGYRFIRDAPDQLSFNEKRIKNIISSTGGVVAFLPDRGNGGTSQYILNEILYAKELNIPAFVVPDPAVPRSLLDAILPEGSIVISPSDGGTEALEDGLIDFVERTRPPRHGTHCFIGHAIKQGDGALWDMAARVAEVVSGLRCVSGDGLMGDGAQNMIVESIRSSAISVFDISDDRLNSCIEAGVARGAGARYELVCRGARHRPPFMFRDKQVFYYETDAELLGLVRRLTFDCRRVVS